MPLQELNLLDVNSFIEEIHKSGLIQRIIDKVVTETLPEMPESFPFILETITANLNNIIESTVKNERINLLNMHAIEVYDLGHGFSLEDGTFKKKVISMNFAPHFYKLNIDSNNHIVYHLDEHVIIERVPIEYQKNTVNKSSTLENYLNQVRSKFQANSSLNFTSSKLDFEKACNFTNNIMGLSYSSNSPEMNITVSINVDSLAQVHFDRNIDLSDYITNPLKIKLDQLEKM